MHPLFNENTGIAQEIPKELLKAAGQGQPAVRELNLKERVMSHDQRISLLEQQNAALREGVEKLVALLVDQMGLTI
jgi:hypothetical protein